MPNWSQFSKVQISQQTTHFFFIEKLLNKLGPKYLPHVETIFTSANLALAIITFGYLFSVSSPAAAGWQAVWEGLEERREKLNENSSQELNRCQIWFAAGGKLSTANGWQRLVEPSLCGKMGAFGRSGSKQRLADRYNSLPVCYLDKAVRLFRMLRTCLKYWKVKSDERWFQIWWFDRAENLFKLNLFVYSLCLKNLSLYFFPILILLGLWKHQWVFSSFE